MKRHAAEKKGQKIVFFEVQNPNFEVLRFEKMNSRKPRKKGPKKEVNFGFFAYFRFFRKKTVFFRFFEISRLFLR